ncbi:MAG: hypothetical protein JXR30_03040 [Alphaproteobacteria bacterium]|nr:hypothetical protein [Alphaproteobacteria bacterium]
MVSEKDKLLIEQFFIPTIQDSEMDKASVAGLCRMTAERKFPAMLVPSNHIGFAWSCLEYHSALIISRFDIESTTIAELAKVVKEGVDFCELLLPESFFYASDLDAQFYLYQESLSETLPLGKTLMALPYYALSSREQTGLFLRLFAPYRGLVLTQDGLPVAEKLMRVYRLFETIRESGILPSVIYFDLIGLKDPLFFAQNVIRLKKQILKGITFDFGFHVAPKVLLKNGLLK